MKKLLIENNYLKSDNEPIKCWCCGSDDLKDEVINGTEIQRICNHCGRKLGVRLHRKWRALI